MSQKPAKDAVEPMVVNCTVYSNDGRKLRDIGIDEIGAALKEPAQFIWVGLREPDEPLLQKLQQVFGLHALAIEDAHRAHQRTKIEAYGDGLFLAVHTAQMQDGRPCYGETNIFLGHNYLVSVRHGASLSYATARRTCESSPELLALGPSYVLYAMLDFTVDNYLPVVDSFQTRLNQLEHSVLDGEFSRGTIARLYNLKKELVRLRMIVAPLQDVLGELMNLYPGLVREDVRPYFRDVNDHAARINDAADTMREMLTAAMDVNLALVGISQNDVFKRIAGWGLLLTAPMMIASWYGMNFHDMPELTAPHGYAIAAGVTLGICAVLYILLRRAKWL
jgi:magnesium transporter